MKRIRHNPFGLPENVSETDYVPITRLLCCALTRFFLLLTPVGWVLLLFGIHDIQAQYDEKGERL